MTLLPNPDADALQHSRRLIAHIQDEVAASGGWIDFSRYMHLALYAPGLGYYSAGARKFGAAGDFTTAPEMSALFTRTLARQVAQILDLSGGDILELGAGSGRLAQELLLELAAAERLPARYFILEVSAQLRQAQQQALTQALPPALLQRVSWLDALPSTFTGVVLGNEVLDALPVHLFSCTDHGYVEHGVSVEGEGLTMQQRALTSTQLLQRIARLELPVPYTSEVCPAATALIASLADMLQAGVILLLDYGFSQAEYYHPHRDQGTLMCHYRHYAHGDALFHPGLQDITAHVDFTATAEAGLAYGLGLLGYCGQAQFLINCGITEVLAQVSAQDVAAYAPLAAQAQKLLSPAEMGELFKVIALGRGVPDQLLGFQRGDRRHTL